jgi:hypothetical protein
MVAVLLPYQFQLRLQVSFCISSISVDPRMDAETFILEYPEDSYVDMNLTVTARNFWKFHYDCYFTFAGYGGKGWSKAMA